MNKHELLHLNRDILDDLFLFYLHTNHLSFLSTTEVSIAQQIYSAYINLSLGQFQY